MNMNAPRMACCCVVARAEMNSPTPMTERQVEDRAAVEQHHRAAQRHAEDEHRRQDETVVWTRPISSGGTILPIRISASAAARPGAGRRCRARARGRPTGPSPSGRSAIAMLPPASAPCSTGRSRFGLNQMRGTTVDARRTAQRCPAGVSAASARDDLAEVARDDLRGVRAPAVEDELHLGRAARRDLAREVRRDVQQQRWPSGGRGPGRPRPVDAVAATRAEVRRALEAGDQVAAPWPAVPVEHQRHRRS